MTERERILERREDFMDGVRAAVSKGCCPKCGDTASFTAMRQYAAGLFPFPTITRARVVQDPSQSTAWRVCDGALQYNFSGMGWERATDSAFVVTPARVAIWADLYANPTEEVPDDGASSPSLPGASS